MSGDLRRRIDRLAAAYRRPEGCATCRHWQPVVLVGEDGPSRPERCPDCGRAVPIAQRVHIGVRLASI